MRWLLLLRHAKSSWADPGLSDHDRPLAERGRRAAAAMGRYLRHAGLVPDRVLCSSARRACETAALLGLPERVALEVDHGLYLADPESVLARIRAVDDGTRRLLVIGHNPTTQELALHLGGEGDRAARARIAAKYPTGALSVIRIDGSWAVTAGRSARLERFVAPRDLEEAIE